MIKKPTFLAFFLSLATILSAQADLVVTAAGFQPNSIAKGDIFQVQATVTNIGNATAGENYFIIYYSKDLFISDEDMISQVSIKELAPNESQEISFIYPIPTPLNSGYYYLAFEIDPYNQVQETDEDNLFCASNATDCVTFQITNSVLKSQKLPYPIIFVHGWTGSSNTWEDFTNEVNLFYGWTYGGRLDYCLNPDGDRFTADGYINPFVNMASLNEGDYYTINFDISANGELFVGNDLILFNDDLSNQSAIVKQGWAISDAIEKVMNITGAEKVILVGHSMGGLACREYLQNFNNWQVDNKHHVAKLLTIGTPNGGSNISASQAGTLFGWDELSEAVRDLRYPSILFGGQYLFGGFENIFGGSYNNDVDCNGFEGNEITGLNEKPAPTDVNYSCIVGVLAGIQSDGIVSAFRADLNNYLFAQPPQSNILADRFDVNSTHLKLHKENHPTLIKGLDETPYYEQAYPIPLNSFYYGFSTEQAPNSPFYNDADWDDFEIEVPEPGLLQIKAYNIPVNAFALFLLDEDLEELQEVQSFGESNIELAYAVNPGKYFIEIGSIPTPNSWRFPYALSTVFTAGSGLSADFTSNLQEGCVPFTVNFSSQSEGNPTHFAWTFTGGVPATSTAQNPTVTYHQPGVYPVTLTVSNALGENTITQNGFITVKAKAEADFSFAVQTGSTVSFTNQTQYTQEAPVYNWDFGDGQVSIEVSPVHTYTAPGTYTAKLTASNTCGNTNISKVVEIMPVSTGEDYLGSEISVYPNPGDGIFTVKIEGPSIGEHSVVVYNNLGQLISQSTLQKTADSMESKLDITHAPSGIYFIRVNAESGDQLLKFLKN